ncbi:MAG: threonine synthase [Acidaminococcaceae bacterium]|jgi:threonine synthase|nr:threonine synthase [Acidaminococcaceae bacterium]
MLYLSTRGKTEMVSSAHAITGGLATDGGLYVPQEYPGLSKAEIDAMGSCDYKKRAMTVLSKFLTDFSETELKECIDTAYDPSKFGGFPAPLHPLTNDIDILELWHGPTSAFKDMALQILPSLLTKSIVKTGEQKKVIILVATSGDTGKAALAGFADVPGTEIIVFYPQNGVSPMQKKQMITQQGTNVHVVAVKGNFDDAQKGVKEILGDKELGKLLAEKGAALSSANSINWGRLVPQIVYYFSAYADAIAKGKIKIGDSINFSVPTGNFGDIFAGFIAKLMGLPVNKLICASNSNNVLTDFINTGTYNKKREFHKTISPSMDILVSSNLERLLYEVTDHDSVQVSKWMEELQTKGTYSVDRNIQERILNTFFGTWVDEIETSETIGNVFTNYRYLLDPHTAVAYRALEKYRLLTSDNTYSIVLSTASPFKFSKVVLSALEPDADFTRLDDFQILDKLSTISGIAVPANLAGLKEAPVLHLGVIPKEEMENQVKVELNLPITPEPNK